MPKLVLTKAYPGYRGMMQAGEYQIPQDISLADAKAARGDGAGYIVRDEPKGGPVDAGQMFSPAGGAPEHKEQRAAAPGAASIDPPTIEPPSSPQPTRARRGNQARR